MHREHVEGTLRIRVSEKMLEVIGFLISGTSSSKEESKRGNITSFSSRSSSRLRRYLVNTSIDYISFITLTIPALLIMDSCLFKQRFDVFCKSLFRRFGKLSLVWVLEFTKQGTPHFHCLSNCFIGKSELSELWSSVWSDLVDEETYQTMLKVSTNVQGMHDYHKSIDYLCYLYKDNQKDVPSSFSKVGRFWGVRGLRSVVVADTYEIPVFSSDIEDLKESFNKEVQGLNELLETCNIQPVIMSDINEFVVYGSLINRNSKNYFNNIQYKLRSVLHRYYVEPDETEVKAILDSVQDAD